MTLWLKIMLLLLLIIRVEDRLLHFLLINILRPKKLSAMFIVSKTKDFYQLPLLILMIDCNYFLHIDVHFLDYAHFIKIFFSDMLITTKNAHGKRCSFALSYIIGLLFSTDNRSLILLLAFLTDFTQFKLVIIIHK